MSPEEIQDVLRRLASASEIQRDAGAPPVADATDARITQEAGR
jgi:hypothetical protein